MSGARALASARRRRAEPQNVMPQNSQTKNSREVNNVTDINDDVDAPKTKMSPAMMLLSHNKIIENMQKVIENLDNRMNEQEKKSEERIKEIVNSSKTDANDIEFYKTKMTSIENTIEEIKKHTLKVQTFSMETNLQLVELKKRLNKYEKNEIEKQDKQREHIIEHINTVSTILTKINCEVEQSKEVQTIQNNTLVDILEGINNKIVCENRDLQQEEDVDEEEEEVENEDEGEEVENEDEEVENEDEGEEVENKEGEEVENEDEEVENEVEVEGEEVENEEVDSNLNNTLDGINEDEEEDEENLENDEGEDSTKLNF